MKRSTMKQDSNNQKNLSSKNNLPNSNTVKDPSDWTTGGEDITGAQKSYLTTLAEEAGEEIDTDITKAEASQKIDELQQKTGRGVDH